MNHLFVIIFIGIFLYSGIVFFMIAFGLKTPKFKNFQQQARFEANYKKYQLLFKIGAIFYLVSFILVILRSNVLNRIF